MKKLATTPKTELALTNVTPNRKGKMENKSQNQVEEVAKLKKIKFESTPDRFVDLDDVIIALIRTEQGPAILCKPSSRQEAAMAKAECDIALTKLILRMETPQHSPKGGIISAVRNRIVGKRG